MNALCQCAGQPAASQSSLAAAAGALCSALDYKDPALAVSAAAALGHAGVRGPLPLPLGALKSETLPDTRQRAAAGGSRGSASGSAAAAGAAENAKSGAGAAAAVVKASSGVDEGAASSAAAGASAAKNDREASGEHGAAGAAAKSSPSPPAEAAPATRLGAVAGIARLMADKEPKARVLLTAPAQHGAACALLVILLWHKVAGAGSWARCVCCRLWCSGGLSTRRTAARQAVSFEAKSGLFLRLLRAALGGCPGGDRGGAPVSRR